MSVRAKFQNLVIIFLLALLLAGESPISRESAASQRPPWASPAIKSPGLLGNEEECMALCPDWMDWMVLGFGKATKRGPAADLSGLQDLATVYPLGEIATAKGQFPAHTGD